MSLPIANEWFVRKRYADDVTLITEPHVHPFLRCNIWHVRGRERDLIIDTGMGIGNLAQAAKDLLDKPVSVVLTHAHVDHVGGAHQFGQCYAHPLEMPSVMKANDRISLDTQKWPGDLLAMLQADGPVQDFVITARPHGRFEPAAYSLKPARSVAPVEAGDVIDLGDRVFEIVHLPGHSPGSIGLWEKASGTLFSGDAIYDGQLLDELPGSDPVSYQHTMRFLLTLPVNVVHGGHDESFGRQRMCEIATSYLTGSGEQR